MFKINMTYVFHLSFYIWLGAIDISKAIAINEKFQISRQFWSYLIKQGLLPEPHYFIKSTPHMTFVHGEKNVTFLK